MSVTGAFPDEYSEELQTASNARVEKTRESSSAAERFISSFLREQNIRWMLVIGAAIVFGSSLMLVSREYSSWPVGLKYLTVLGYTGLIFAVAEIGRTRLGLKVTSRVLHVLTLFLLPVCFLALNWATSSGLAGSLMNVAEAIAWGVPAAAFLLFASTRIFDYQLHGRQTTFVAAYSILSIAGALPRITHPMLSFGLSFVLWFVMSAGMVKVNRHIFWLAEEHRWPRIFAFFPSLLLGTLFLVLMVTRTAVGISTEWIGFGCVLVSATILTNARTVADVFRKRTGDLIRPLPWSIILPVIAGLIWMVVGLGLAFAGFPRTLALIPSCALATAILIAAARETNHRGFVWGAILTALMTYQFSPTLFRETAMALRSAAEAGLQTPKLPLAFYGLTYLPFILGVALVYRVLRTKVNTSLAEPLRIFACCLAVFLQVTAMTNGQALFLVSSVNVVTFFVLGLIFRDRSIARISLISLVAAITMLAPFFEADSGTSSMFLLIQRTLPSVALCVSALGFVLAVTRVGDRLLRLVPQSPSASENYTWIDRIGEILGLALSSGVAVYWIISEIERLVFPHGSFATWIHGLLPLVTFAIHTIRYRSLVSGSVFWILMLAGLVIPATAAGIDGDIILNFITTTSALGSIAGSLWFRSQDVDAIHIRSLPKNLRHSNQNIQRGLAIHEAFLIPFTWIGHAIMAASTVTIALPLLVYHNLNQSAMPIPLVNSMVVAWLTTVAVFLNNRLAGVLSAFLAPLLASSLTITAGFSNAVSLTHCFVIWAVTASAGSIIYSWKTTPSTKLALTVSRAWMLATMAVSITQFNFEHRLVPAVVLPAFLLVNPRSLSLLQRTIIAILVNIHLLLLAGGLMGLRGPVSSIVSFPNAEVLRIYFPLLVVSVIAFEFLGTRLEQELVDVWQVMLRVSAGLMVAVAIPRDQPSTMSIIMTVSTFAAAIVFEFTNAIRRQQEFYVWNALALIVGCTGWMIAEHLIVPGAGISQILLMVSSAIALTIAEKSRHSDRTRVLVRPMQTVGMALPMLVSAIALARNMFSSAEVRGLQSLAVFGCAAIYFHQWLLSHKHRYAILAGVIVNLAFVMLWRSLHFSDPQFYMVPIGLSILGLTEILKRELPLSSHDPLRYIGALVILVSPVFDILSGSWAHLLSLLVLSTLVVLLSIGLRLRALIYTGTAFILADLVGMIFRATEDRMSLLWIGGLGLGVAVITLAAVCENHRDRVLARIRTLSAALATWE